MRKYYDSQATNTDGSPSPSGAYQVGGEILEGNRLIGQFMGYRMFDKRYPRNHGIGAPEAEWKDMIVEKAKYHCFWGWIMPVVEEIEKYAHVRIQVGICAINRKFMDAKLFAKEKGIPFDEVMPIAEHNDRDFIGNVWASVVDFIKWHNEQTPSSHPQ